MTPVVLLLPWPPAELSPNSRTHWREKATYVAAYRAQCKVLALNERRARENYGAVFPMTPPVDARITFVLTDRRRRDADNLLSSMKAGLDGIKDAGLIEDDNVFVFHPTVEAEIGDALGVRVVLG